MNWIRAEFLTCRDTQLGASVTDLVIFRDLAAKWEESFYGSMKSLRVERPTTVTRVSEYIPEIVKFVEEIIERGFAYEAGGNVWFNTSKFDGYEGGEGGWKHTYAKLQPWSKGNRELLQDGEGGIFPRSFPRLSTDLKINVLIGALSGGTGKREVADFGLWKKSKSGEPAWPSPWGPGRPGWHIECSVMASAVHTDGIDVHSGGIDLAFPHHDNELAQSEVRSPVSCLSLDRLL